MAKIEIKDLERNEKLDREARKRIVGGRRTGPGAWRPKRTFRYDGMKPSKIKVGSILP